MHPQIKTLTPYFLLSILFIASAIFRPLLPIDETRYLTVAWEMFLNKNYLVPTLNFEPYHHKPPMLFWLINLSWSVFGVSRWAALVPIFACTAAALHLTKRLANNLYGDKSELVGWLMLGTVPFLAYGTLVMFDMAVTVIVLSAVLVFLNHVKSPRLQNMFFIGVLLGFGLMTKGPVIYLYVLPPMLFYPYWKSANDTASRGCVYKGIALAFVVSLITVSIWLVPALMKMSGNFAFWLVWEQTAGRITGNFGASHARPFYFYLMLLPLIAMPWIFFPGFWRAMRNIKESDTSTRFLASATIPAFLCFCLIAGKQPHYLLPFLPFVITWIGSNASFSGRLKPSALSTALLLIVACAQPVAEKTKFNDFNLVPMSEFYKSHQDAGWAWVRNYQGEIGFLARAENKIESVNNKDLHTWFKQHPHGYAIIRYGHEQEVASYKELFSHTYRGKHLGVFQSP